MMKFVLVVAGLAVLAEPAPAQTASPLTGGGVVSISRDGELWRVVVTGPRAGLASLCLAERSRVRILHASAAIGEGVYEPSGDAWVLKSGFEFALRDTRKGPPAEDERRAYLGNKGWVANADNSGTRPREFLILLSDGARLGVTLFRLPIR